MSCRKPLDIPLGYPCSASFASLLARVITFSFSIRIITGALVSDPDAMMHGVVLSLAVPRLPSRAFGSIMSLYLNLSMSTILVATRRVLIWEAPCPLAVNSLKGMPINSSCSFAWYFSLGCSFTFSIRIFNFGLFALALLMIAAAALMRSPSWPFIPFALSLAPLKPLHGVAASAMSYVPRDSIFAISNMSWQGLFTVGLIPFATFLVSASSSQDTHFSMDHPRSSRIRYGAPDPDARSSTRRPLDFIRFFSVLGRSRSISIPVPADVSCTSSLSFPWSTFIFMSCCTPVPSSTSMFLGRCLGSHILASTSSSSRPVRSLIGTITLSPIVAVPSPTPDISIGSSDTRSHDASSSSELTRVISENVSGPIVTFLSPTYPQNAVVFLPSRADAGCDLILLRSVHPFLNGVSFPDRSIADSHHPRSCEPCGYLDASPSVIPTMPRHRICLSSSSESKSFRQLPSALVSLARLTAAIYTLSIDGWYGTSVAASFLCHLRCHAVTGSSSFTAFSAACSDSFSVLDALCLALSLLWAAATFILQLLTCFVPGLFVAIFSVMISAAASVLRISLDASRFALLSDASFLAVAPLSFIVSSAASISTSAASSILRSHAASHALRQVSMCFERSASSATSSLSCISVGVDPVALVSLPQLFTTT